MYNPLLLIDFYKATHHEQYPVGLTKMVAYLTPRMSRLKDVDALTVFGYQGFVKEYLIEYFNEAFFKRPEDEVVNEYNRILTATLGAGAYEDQKIRDLHRLGYLPLEISAAPEGMRTKIGVPQVEITNTLPQFVWLVNTIESLLSCYIWHMEVAAEVSRRYFLIADKWVKKTCDDTVNPHTIIGDFSMRGQHSPESAFKASAAWLLSNFNTATVPAIMYLEKYYNCDCTTEVVGRGAISTEHSVMCSNAAVDGDEITHIKRLLTEIYPNHNFSMVSDSYDYWRLVTELLPQCKEEVLAHNGTLLIRGDSGNPVEILAGKNICHIDKETLEYIFEAPEEEAWNWGVEEDIDAYYECEGKYYHYTATPEWTNERGAYTDAKYYFVDNWDAHIEEVEPSAELLGTVWALDQIFGHSVNSKGYKVLNPHVKAIYGDSIIPDYAEEIFARLASNGYATNNVVLGAGSLSMMALVGKDNTTGDLVFAGECNGTNCGPYTRDTFGIAVKTTYAEDADGNPIMIYKQPKALSWKRSQKGCCVVAADGQSYTDSHTFAEARATENLLRPIFKDGKTMNETSLAEIRERMGY